MNALTFAVIGQDLRQCYLAEYIQRQGHQVLCYGLPHFVFSDGITMAPSLDLAIQTADVIAGPVPFSLKTVPYMENALSCLKTGSVLAAGCLSESVRERCKQQGAICYDYMESEFLIWTNAAITAEGMVSEVMKKTPFALFGSKALVIGYGRCGQMTAKRLSSMGCATSICEADQTRLAQASACGYFAFPAEKLDQHLWDSSIVVNTVPSKIITEDFLAKSRPSSETTEPLVQSISSSAPILFDLASAPGGIDLEACRKHGLEAYSCPGLPGKIAPKTAGEAVGKAILRQKGIKL